jgi:hypothetical protein
MKPFPEEFGKLNGQIQALRCLVEANAGALVIGRATAPVHLECINRIMVYWDKFDATIGFEFLSSQLTPEENLPRANTALRMLDQLSGMVVAQTERFLSCFGGTAVVGVQQFESWAVGNPARQEFALEFLAVP